MNNPRPQITSAIRATMAHLGRADSQGPGSQERRQLRAVPWVHSALVVLLYPQEGVCSGMLVVVCIR